jgi:hypothetical protein
MNVHLASSYKSLYNCVNGFTMHALRMKRHENSSINQKRGKPRCLFDDAHRFRYGETVFFFLFKVLLPNVLTYKHGIKRTPAATI